MAAPIPRSRFGLFRESASDTVRKLFEQAIKSSDENAYIAAINYLEDLYKQDPHDPVMRSWVSSVRSTVWPQGLDNPSLNSQVTPDTFRSLSANFRKFSEGSLSKAGLDVSPKPTNERK